MTENHEQLTERIKGIITQYPWVWNDLAKVIAIVWKDDLINIGHDLKLLSSEGLLNELSRSMMTAPEKINKVFKELQLINNNSNSNTLNMMNQSDKKPQRVFILNHLKEKGKITPYQSWKLYGIYRLSSVIKRLRKAGHNIKTNLIGEQRYAEYELIISN